MASLALFAILEVSMEIVNFCKSRWAFYAAWALLGFIFLHRDGLTRGAPQGTVVIALGRKVSGCGGLGSLRPLSGQQGI